MAHLQKVFHNMTPDACSNQTKKTEFGETSTSATRKFRLHIHIIRNPCNRLKAKKNRGII